MYCFHFFSDAYFHDCLPKCAKSKSYFFVYALVHGWLNRWEECVMFIDSATKRIILFHDMNVQLTEERYCIIWILNVHIESFNTYSRRHVFHIRRTFGYYRSSGQSAVLGYIQRCRPFGESKGLSSKCDQLRVI
jgi:hypothetical protein